MPNRRRFLRILARADTEPPPPAPEPFAGNYTWWADINDALHSNSGGTEYIDSVPLIGIVDSLTQPTAINRPEFVAAGLDGNATMRATSTTALQQQVIYKGIDAAAFNGSTGTFAFLARMEAGGAVARTFFTEAAANASAYNFQIFRSSSNMLMLYTPTDGNQDLGAFTNGTWAVHHFTLAATSFKYYRNGALIATKTVNQAMSTPRPLTAFGYKALDAERGIGSIGDIVVKEGVALDGTAVLNDYNNFWKPKYPSLP